MVGTRAVFVLVAFFVIALLIFFSSYSQTDWRSDTTNFTSSSNSHRPDHHGRHEQRASRRQQQLRAAQSLREELSSTAAPQPRRDPEFSSFAFSPFSSISGKWKHAAASSYYSNYSNVDAMLRISLYHANKDCAAAAAASLAPAPTLGTARALECIARNPLLQRCAASEWAKLATRRLLAQSGVAQIPASLSPSPRCAQYAAVLAARNFSRDFAALRWVMSRFAFEFVADSVGRGLYRSLLRTISSSPAVVPSPRKLKKAANQDKRGPVYPHAMVFLPSEENGQHSGEAVFTQLLKDAASLNPASPASCRQHKRSAGPFAADSVDLLSDDAMVGDGSVSIQCTSSLRVPLRRIKLIGGEQEKEEENGSDVGTSLSSSFLRPAPFVRASFRFDGLHHLLQSPRVGVAPTTISVLAAEQENRRRRQSSVRGAAGGRSSRNSKGQQSADVAAAPFSLLGIAVPVYMWRAEALSSAAALIWGSEQHPHNRSTDNNAWAQLASLALHEDVLTNGNWPKILIHTDIHVDLAIARFVSDAVGKANDAANQTAAAPSEATRYRDFNDVMASRYGSQFAVVHETAQQQQQQQHSFLNDFENEHITNFLRVMLNYFLHLSSRRNVHFLVLFHTIQDCDALLRQPKLHPLFRQQQPHQQHQQAHHIFGPVCGMFFVRSLQLWRLRRILREEIMRAFLPPSSPTTAATASDWDEEEDAFEVERERSETLSFIRQKWNTTHDGNLFARAANKHPDLAYHLRNAERFLSHDVEVAARNFIRNDLLAATSSAVASRLERKRLASLMARTVFFHGMNMQRYQHMCGAQGNGVFCEATTDSIHPEPFVVEQSQLSGVLHAVMAMVESCRTV